MKKVILIKGISKYNVLRYWTDKLAMGFEKLGIETIVIDLKYSLNNQILHILSMEVDAVIAFNGVLSEQKEVLEKVIKAPFIYLLIDHPIDHIGRIINLREKDILTVMDRNDINYLKFFSLYPKNVFLLPHAAIEVSNQKVPKDIDILISGSFSNPNDYLGYITQQSPTIKKICMEVINTCLANTNLYYIDEFFEDFEKRGFKLEIDINKNPQFIKMLHEVGRYIYSKKRLRVIQALAESGLNISIYGSGWGGTEWSQYSNIQIHQPVNYWETQALMRRSKIVLNFQALLKDGTHERVLNGMAARSVVVTNETPLLKELFKDGEEIIFYSFDDMDSMISRIKYLLSNEELQNQISDSAWGAVKNLHTFDERAKQIRKIYLDLLGK